MWDLALGLDCLLRTLPLLGVAFGERFVRIKCKRGELRSVSHLLLVSLLVSLSYLLLQFFSPLLLKHVLVYSGVPHWRLPRHITSSNHADLVIKMLFSTVDCLFMESLLVGHGRGLSLRNCRSFTVIVPELVWIKVGVVYRRKLKTKWLTIVLIITNNNRLCLYSFVDRRGLNWLPLVFRAILNLSIFLHFTVEHSELLQLRTLNYRVRSHLRLLWRL